MSCRALWLIGMLPGGSNIIHVVKNAWEIIPIAPPEFTL
jgi:hypothetical protein